MILKSLKAAALTAALLFSANAFVGTATAAEVIGEYANGCIKGAVPLNNGNNYQVQIWGRAETMATRSLSITSRS